MTGRIVFAYSGTPESWAAIASAAAARNAEIITLTLDLGQGADLSEVRDRALAAGAARAHVLDVREQFAREYVLPALHAGVLQQDPLALMLAAQLVARKLEDVAVIEGAAAAVEAVTAHDNLLGRRGSAYKLTKSPADAPQTPARVEIAFDRGVPVSVNGVPMPLTELIESLTIIAGHHGVGRIAVDGMCGEAPAASVLVAAYAALADVCQPSAVTGTVRLQLLKGSHTVTAVDAASRIPDAAPRLAVGPP